MSQYLNLKTFPLLILVFFLSLLFFFDPSNPSLSKDSVVFSFFIWAVCLGISFRKKRRKVHPLFQLACILLIGLSTINGINGAPVVYFPQKLNLKLLYVASLCFTIYLFLKNVHPIFLFIHTVAFSCSPPLFSSIKSIPLLLFVIASFFYLIPKRIRIHKLHAIISFFFFVLLISSLLSYKSQSALLQLCLLFSGVLIFFLLSSYPSRLIKKGLLLILSLNLLLNIVNLFSAVHLIWPFNFFVPPLFLTYAGFPVSAIAVISAFSALVVFYTAFQYRIYSWFLIPVGIISIYLVFFNHSRASLLAFILAALYIILFFWNKKRISLRILIPISILFPLLLIGSILFTPLETASRYFNAETLLIRFSLWNFHFQSVLQNFPLFGIGLDADSLLAHLPGTNSERVGYEDFYRFLHSFRSYPQAHNLYVETFTSLGILGSLLFLWIGIYLLFITYLMLTSKSKEVTNSGIFISGVLVFVAVHEFFDYNLGEQHFFIPVVLSLSLIRIKLSFPIRKFKQNLSFKTVYMIVLILLGFLSFQLIWEQRLKNLILASTQDEIELDNFLIYKEKKPSGNRKKFSHPFEEILKNQFWIRSEENIVLASLILRKSPDYQDLVESLLNRCVIKNPYSSVCWKEKADVLSKKDQNVTRELEEGKKTDPFHIIFTE
ncbi:O-antigen ligase [Leptospira interrogans serovar Grippotyphosa str. 2006006986]|uniref:O-antigen ligase family protein n=1 Tax=Leptospira interrogans TaxID=173 RepID=UPI000292978F|nr:O-antigen ligase family protein [Leptospira interrogans]EKO85461.1 O-antigen ligase [Leptospira interrogans serovar Grippotyphosa str. Andaman]EKP86393.1 O-antigen ligase [Leptospira interrogans serovar Grippotyphosa str. 2006006986]